MANGWHRFRRDRTGVVALAFLMLLVLLAIVARFVAPYDPIHQPLEDTLKNLPPSLAHPFGTDQYNRDVLSRVIYGARVSLGVGVFAVLVSATVGTLYGALAGFFGGAVDSIAMRFVDVALAVPRVLIVIIVVALWHNLGALHLVLLLGLTGWLSLSRLVRAHVLTLAGRDFALAARALGVTRWRVLWRHVLPNVSSTIIVAAALGVGNVIALEAGLSYLGIGVPPPDASWGNIMRDGMETFTTAWWTVLFPGLAITMTVLASNALGDALRDALDVRTK